MDVPRETWQLITGNHSRIFRVSSSLQSHPNDRLCSQPCRLPLLPRGGKGESESLEAVGAGAAVQKLVQMGRGGSGSKAVGWEEGRSGSSGRAGEEEGEGEEEGGQAGGDGGVAPVPVAGAHLDLALHGNPCQPRPMHRPTLAREAQLE